MNEMEMILPGSVLAALGSLVLEQNPDRTFVQCGDAPGWLRRLARGLPGPHEPIQLESWFPFLEVFLPEAEHIWDGGGPARLDSELWSETADDGEELPLEATALRVGARRVLVITRNDALFRERRLVLQRARELRLTYDALSREMEQRDILMHCIVHDLASPLNTMLGVLSSLDEQALPGGSASMARLALDAAMRQRSMIREILTMFAFERGSADAPKEENDVSDLRSTIAHVIEALEVTARGKLVRIEGPPRAGAGQRQSLVIADEARLFRVLSNLLENAIRHSPSGGRVRVSVREEHAMVEVSIEDQGPGAPPALVPRLFQELGHDSGPKTDTGLGLYFCRITVERWGGSIGYDSAPDGGARFWFRLRKQ
jgi:signal transduction histidine kinase